MNRILLLALMFITTGLGAPGFSDDFWDKCPGPACPANKPVPPDTNHNKRAEQEKELLEKERELLERERKIIEREYELKKEDSN